MLRARQAFVHFHPGVVGAQCEVQAPWNEKQLPGWNKDWLGTGFKVPHHQCLHCHYLLKCNYLLEWG